MLLHGLLSAPGRFSSFKGLHHYTCIFRSYSPSAAQSCKVPKMVKCAPRPDHASSSRPKEQLTTQTITAKPTKPRPFLPVLPLEIIIQIVMNIILPNEYVRSGRALAACCLLSRQWYAAACKPLYNISHIFPRQFYGYVRTVCPAINAHSLNTELVNLITVVNLECLVYVCESSMLKLLRRVKDTLEVFIAPRSNFTYDSIFANFLD